MRTRLCIALEEELAIDKLYEAELTANKTGEDAVLYDNLKKDKDAKNQEAPTDDIGGSGDDVSNPTDNSDPPVEADPVEDTGDSDPPAEDPPPEDPKPEEEPKEDKPKPDVKKEEDDPKAEKPEEGSEEPAQEEYKHFTYATEDFASAMVSTGEHFKAAVVALGVLGITYGPGIAKSVYKGVTYAFSKLAKLLYVSSTSLNKYMARRVNSFENLKADIATLQKAAGLISEKEEQVDLGDHAFTNQKVINALKIQDNVDVTANIVTLQKFVSTLINDLGRQIVNDNAAIKHIISYSQMGVKKPVATLLGSKPFSANLVKGTVPGYAVDDQYTESYKYNEPLPSDVVLMAMLPKEGLTELEDFAKAYSNAGIVLGVDATTFKEVVSIDYMTNDTLTGFLTELDKLCDICIAHQTLYENIKRDKAVLRFSFKQYFERIARSTEKVPLKDSLVDCVYLRTMYIDKVYLVAAMDAHDYSARIITYGLSYVRDNLRKLS